MANLRWFRKHQKVMLVVFGVILMAVFVFTMVVPPGASQGPSAVSQEQRDRYNTPIVKWSGGQLTRGQLANLLDLHYATVNFQRALIEDSFRHSPQGPWVERIRPIQNNSVESADRAVFGRFMLAQFAKERFGMVLSDDAVYDYLQALSNGDIDQAYLTRIARRANQNIGYNQLHEYLKMELTAMRMEQIIGESFYVGLMGAAPVTALDAWQAFLQNEKQIECAVEEFKAEDYLAQVTEQPSNADLRKIYNEGKTLDVDATGEKPGFKRPRKVRVEYVMADPIAFLDLAIQDVTAEQVLAEYNRLVEVKDPIVMEPVARDESEPAQAEEGEKLEDEAPEGDQQNPGETPDDKNDGGDPAPAPSGEEGQPPADPETGDGQAPAPSDSSNPSPQEPAPENKDGDGNSRRLMPRTKFVSTRTSQKEAQESAPPTQEPAPSGDAPQESAEEPSQTPDMQEAADPQEPGKSEAESTEAQAQEPAQDVPQDSSQQVRKLDAELEKLIKQRMKREESMQNMQKSLEKVRNMMQEYSLDVQQYESSKNLPDTDQFPMPVKLDLAAIATENHLQHGITELSTFEELEQQPVGMAMEFFSDPATGQFANRRAVEVIFMNFDRASLYTLESINGFTSTYLFWMTEKVESRIPSFEEAQSDVIAFWKRGQSLELAKAAAEKARTELQGKMLATERPDKAKMTGAFRWFQTSMDNVSIGRPLGVTNPGEEFMATAFSLNQNELGVAVNADRTAAYLIQLVTPEPRTAEQLRDLYLDSVASTRRVISSPTNARYSGQSLGKLIDDINEELKVEWLAY